ncbi:MAG: lipoyl synthase [Myxococcaceae bacterium]
MLTTESAPLRLPPSFRKGIGHNSQKSSVFRLLRQSNLNTVCEEARCPNLTECFSNKTATFMILGDRCTRRCHFCSVKTGKPSAPDPTEPANLKQAVLELGLEHVVITSVDRDDLRDLGSHHFAACIRALKEIKNLTVELLTPDFKNKPEAVQIVLEAKPDIWGHNTESVPRLYKQVRPQSNFETTLGLLNYLSQQPNLILKSGLMVGLGETDDEVTETLKIVRQAGVQIITLGQYLRPSLKHWPVARYVGLESYARWQQEAKALGFSACYAGPFVRSSYHAKETYLSISR